ncbi:TraQ [Salmonella enterica]|uniref:Conjugal transfer protein TraQ n=3 Tax=Salmonella enterica TaxID=28901 RepID=A0A619I4J7_SALER|nr:conjugal transfer protein TraQ [Salmonella enterica]EBR8572826.1 TraQ [Salmonella enterica subsp. enterica serovar Java]EBV3242411.1 TraQ [Salmonella enterica subsp. enterica serovar Oranienburg]EBW7308965.1 TraQ [Salmonella enterica subsp. enterica serovar Enteritidis]EBX7469504.1 TraQ [Salmonella enterica subsp. enterica serovar Bareilly]ECA3794836.1 TraQ [Salmonella enterica subsp. enterica serovar Aqua]ECC1750249.1 TraQ [Salmonella enterica subsp. diarizonae]ECF0927199.1 TraQ [Salmone
MDFVQMLANAANSLSGITTQLVLAIAGVGGIALIILYLAGQGGRTRRGQRADSAGTFIAVLLLGCCIISIGSVVNAGANQFALGAVTFDAISYVPEGRYGPAAVAVNAGLTALQTVGWIFALNGLLRLRRSQKDGHTGLTRGDDISSGIKRFICGVLLICNPSVLTLIQNTLKIHW